MTWKAQTTFDSSMFKQTLRIARFSGESDVVSYVAGLTLIDVPAGEVPPADAVALIGDLDVTAFLQAMMDAAWDAGLRPSRAQDERHMKAHLEDMRRFAFHVIKEKP